MKYLNDHQKELLRAIADGKTIQLSICGDYKDLTAGEAITLTVSCYEGMRVKPSLEEEHA